jgi:hypothetical protein
MFLCEEADDRFVIKVSGPIDSHATDNFQVALNQALASATKAVVIDLSESELICSQGYGKLLITNSDLKGRVGSCRSLAAASICAIPFTCSSSTACSIYAANSAAGFLRGRHATEPLLRARPSSGCLDFSIPGWGVGGERLE